ncbi:MAG: bifunctional folylpolyglutamate synthase/dihydrofolate synthase, partial [Bacteroidales bacterium]|nr:bifunctional folylpolyglutamate synthase/dihydrofolate synthase [Bacteroidales bacterium]
MDYKQTTDYLYSLLPAYHRIGKAAYKDNLENTLALDKHFRHPHLNYKTIHIAGTNGKGSVSHVLASVLQEAGYCTGLYTSPHLKDFRERIRINGEMIPEDEVITFVEKHKKIIEEISPSFFELTVAMAFDYFARRHVDIAVIETGLGGRLDSTNIITPVISIITNVGHDHMDLLGDTLQKIAVEKAGIIKKNIPVVIGESAKETRDVFIEKAHETESRICFADEEFRCVIEDDPTGKGDWTFTIENTDGNERVSGYTPLGGDYQSKNLQTVFCVCRHIEDDLHITRKAILNGIRNVIKNTGLMGRWQILRHNPLIICDTGHNFEGLKYTMNQVSRIPARRVHMVLGFVADKDLSLIFPLLPPDAVYYFTRASIPRALDEKILQEKARAYGLNGNSYHTVAEAL